MKIIIKISFHFCLFLVIIYASLKPIYNWDMIGYMGSVIKTYTPNSMNVHEETYRILQSELDKTEYNRLCSGRYRATMASDHRAYYENLSFYSMRIAYVGLIHIFFKLGVSLTFSTVLPSLISVFLIISIIFHVLNKEFKNPFSASVLAFAILFLPKTIFLARLSTPDSLSTLLLLSIAITHVYKFNWLFIFLLMLMSIMTRTDNIIWCILLLLLETLFHSKRNNRLLFLSFSICLIFVYFIINMYNNNGGWETLFYHSLIETQIFPLSLPPSLTFKDYLTAIIKNTPYYLPWFLIIILTLHYLKRVVILEFLKTKGGKIIAACLISFLVKFTLFPLFEARYYFVYILIIFVTIIIEKNVFLRRLNSITA